MTLATARRGSPQRPIRITRRTGNWAPHASGPTRYSPRLLSAEFSPWRIRRSAFREEVPPLLVRFARRRAAAPAARRAGRVAGALSHDCVYKQMPGRDAAASIGMDASRRRRRRANRHFSAILLHGSRLVTNFFVNLCVHVFLCY